MDVKTLRANLKLSQDKFAAKLGVAPYTVRRWEAGKQSPSPMAQDKIQRVFKVKVD